MKPITSLLGGLALCALAGVVAARGDAAEPPVITIEPTQPGQPPLILAPPAYTAVPPSTEDLQNPMVLQHPRRLVPGYTMPIFQKDPRDFPMAVAQHDTRPYAMRVVPPSAPALAPPPVSPQYPALKLITPAPARVAPRKKP
jgi:hypothetical protein